MTDTAPTLKERIAAMPMAEKRAICRKLLWDYAGQNSPEKRKRYFPDFIRRQEEKWDADPSIVDEYLEENPNFVP